MLKRVLFVCVHNSGRSQMAEAFAKRLGQGRIAAESAGTEPGDKLNPVVVEAMAEIGYDMAGHHPKLMSTEMVESADRIITMGCGVESGTCPALFVEAEDWGLDDPHNQPIEKVREIRDQIRVRVEKLIEEL
jgi:arsenate reductase (thioredoxin)